MATSSKKSGESNDFSVEEKIVALYELQKIDSKIDEINKIKGELPLEVQDLEDESAGLETRMANITSEVEGLTTSTKQRKEEIEQAKVLIAKYEQQQDNVRNTREFDSLSKEIEYQKLEIELCEKKIKEYAADIKIKKKMIEDAQAVVAHEHDARQEVVHRTHEDAAQRDPQKSHGTERRSQNRAEDRTRTGDVEQLDQKDPPARHGHVVYAVEERFARYAVGRIDRCAPFQIAAVGEIGDDERRETDEES